MNSNNNGILLRINLLHRRLLLNLSKQVLSHLQLLYPKNRQLWIRRKNQRTSQVNHRKLRADFLPSISCPFTEVLLIEPVVVVVVVAHIRATVNFKRHNETYSIYLYIFLDVVRFYFSSRHDISLFKHRSMCLSLFLSVNNFYL